jgi:signal peptidase II
VTPRRLGIIAAAIALVADQASKLWLLHVFDIKMRQPVNILPVFDLVLTWNRGISYSMFQANTDMARWGLFAFTVAATIALAVWLWRSDNPVLGTGLGLIVGGAIGNAIDRGAYGAVMDFAYFYLDTDRWGRLSWYVFNIADVAIVAGVALLLYDSFFGSGKKETAVAK